jgi:DsbC/DsbD-like thiol-disulfide interchange protein
MIVSTLRHCAPAMLSGVLLVTAPCFAADAQDASAWDGDARAAVRLIAGGRDAAGGARAGLEIRLGQGWKTYWRYPGDSGVPPVFDFSKSDNVKSVVVSWPAPHRFSDEGGDSIGYKGGVVMPLRVIAQDPARPVTLRLAIDYAICERLCIPAKGAAKVEFPRAASRKSQNDAALADAEARVPKPAPMGGTAPLGIRAVHREPGTPFARVIVDVATAASMPVDLFAEGPSPDWALPLPKPVPGAPAGLQRFSFDIDGVPPGQTADGVRMRFTLVSGDQAVEVTAVPE